MTMSELYLAWMMTARILGYNSPTGANHKGQIPLEANRWYHFAVTRSGDELSFFINGEFYGSFYEPSTDLDWVKIGIIGMDGACFSWRFG